MSRLHAQNEFLATHYPGCMKESDNITWQVSRRGGIHNVTLGIPLCCPLGKGVRSETLGQGLGGEGLRRRN